MQVEFDPVAFGERRDLLTLTTNGSTNPTVRLLGMATGVGAEVTNMNFIANRQVLPLTIYNYGVAGTS